MEKTTLAAETLDARGLSQQSEISVADDREGQEGSAAVSGHGSWVQMSIEIPGFRDDDALPVFLSEMMRESLVGSVADGGATGAGEMAGGLKGRLVINKRWHWRLYIDVSWMSLRWLLCAPEANGLNRFCSSPSPCHTLSLFFLSRHIWRFYLRSSPSSNPKARRTRSSTMTGLSPSTSTHAHQPA